MHKIVREKILILGFLIWLPFAVTAQSMTMIPADEATNVSADMQFKLTFSSSPVLERAGAIRLFKSDSTLVETIDLSQTPSGVPMSATWPWTETLNGSIIRVFRVVVDNKSVFISFSRGAMNYDESYYITADEEIFSNASEIGFKGIADKEWTFRTSPKPAADNNYIVAADGTGDFATLQGALDYIPSDNSIDTKIFVRNGTYIGLAFSKNKNKITIEGENVDSVFIKAYNNSNLNASTHWRSVVNMSGNDLVFINLTMINTTPNGGSQAEALKLSGERIVVVNCFLYSYQDTVLLEGKIYVKDCMIEGDTDFIWGRGTAFFQSCEIRATDNGGYNVMARNNSDVHGYAFADCILTRKSVSTSTHYLARDAGSGYPYAEVVYLNCSLGKHIPAIGWKINSSIDASNILFAEYQSVDLTGNLINISSRDPKSKQLTAVENAKYRDLNWFFNGWIPVLPEYKSVKKPIVIITSPVSGAAIPYTDSVTITAYAYDPDGEIVNVDFFDGEILVGSATSSPFTFTWENFEIGSYNITAVATDTSGLKATSETVKISIIKPVSGVTISHDTITIIEDETMQLTATIEPSDATNTDVRWSHSDNTIATVSTKGLVKGISPGETIITVTSREGNKTDSCIVIVTRKTSIYNQALNDTENELISIYPSPVSDKLNIEFKKNLKEAISVILIDITGKHIMETKAKELNCELDISGLPKGVYLVSITGSDFNAIKRIVKD